MDNFIVSARKYRPTTFGVVVGQKSITSTLKNAISNQHLAQAYLFCGPRGVGKTTCARIFAKTINCQNLSADIEPCNECESCMSFNSNRSLNIHELDAASNNSVDDIRNLIDQVRIPPQTGKYSIYIIDEVHMLSSQAFNAFLKTLEEPPAHAIFILATTEKHKIIPTILSRCQIFDFNRIGVEDIADHLAFVAKSENVEASPDALNIIGQKADGAMRDALSYFDQIVSFSGNQITYEKVIENLNVLDYEYYFQLTSAFLKNDFSNALIVFDQILNKGFDGHHFITGLSKHFRDVLISKDTSTVQLLEVGEGIKKRYAQQASECPMPFLFQALNIANACDLAYKSAQDKRLQVELALINISKITMQPTQVQNTSSGQNASAGNQSTPEKKNENQEVNEKPKEQKIASISIKGALKGEVKKQAVVNEPEQNYKKEEPELKNEFTQEQLIEVWNQFGENVQKEKPRIYNILKTANPLKKSSSQITCTVKNTLQKDAVEKTQAEMMTFISEKLRNNTLELEIEIVELEEQKQLYTDTDKYKYLTEKNENLNKLKQQFNLDF